MAKKSPKICAEARRGFEKFRNNFRDNIDQYHYFHSFILGQQWTDDEEDMLETYKKQALQFNKCATLINTMLGEQQQNTPQLQVVPMENCDAETAKIRELIVKQLMFSGESKSAYQSAASQAFIGGYSAFALRTDYLFPKSFDQDIFYQSFKDPTKCYWDLGAEKVNKTDGMFCGWVSRISRDKFREEYGSKISDKILDETNPITASREEIAEVTQPGTNDPYLWADDQTVTIQYHFKKIPIPETLYKLSNGHIVNQDEMDEIVEKSKKIREEKMIEARLQAVLAAQLHQSTLPPDLLAMQDPNMAPGQYDPLLGQKAPLNSSNATAPVVPSSDQQDLFENEDSHHLTLYDEQEPVRIEDSKDSTTYQIKQYKICGDYVLDETIFPSEQLPLVFVDQNSYYNKEGKQVCRPFLIDAKDAQRYINYLGTQSAYVLKVSRYDQWIGSKKNVASQDTQQKWRDPIAMQGMLTFDESPSGVVPRRIDPPELSQSLLTQYQRSIEDLYTSTGLYPTRLGQQGNEVSGAAIDSRTRQGSYSTYVAFNSINRAIATGGEIVNEMIPHVYDAMRVVALMTPDEGMKNVIINRQTDEYGEHIENDIRKGTYQVRLMPGPSYEGQKEEALLSLNAAIQAAPEVFPLIADLYAENLPLANTIELKNRLKTLVPPNIIEAGKTGKSGKQKPQPPSPQMMEAQFKQAQLQLQQQDIAIRQQELQLKAQKQSADTKLEMARLEADQSQLAMQMTQNQMKYEAEKQKSDSAEQIAHANNFAKILTHTQPQHKGETNGTQF